MGIKYDGAKLEADGMHLHVLVGVLSVLLPQAVRILAHEGAIACVSGYWKEIFEELGIPLPEIIVDLTKKEPQDGREEFYDFTQDRN